MSEQIAGTPQREAMLRTKMLAALVGYCDRPEAEAFADAFVRMSRPPGRPPARQWELDL